MTLRLTDRLDVLTIKTIYRAHGMELNAILCSLIILCSLMDHAVVYRARRLGMEFEHLTEEKNSLNKVEGEDETKLVRLKRWVRRR